MRQKIEDLITTYTRFFEKLGVPAERARPFVERQVEIHAFGVTTHGLTILHAMLNTLEQGGPDPLKEAAVVSDSGTLAVLDGSGTLQVASVMQAVDLAWKRASEHGLAMVSLRNLGWMGVLGYHLSFPARDGFFGLAWGQLAGGATVVPFGGREPRLSTNPVAYCMPADPDPIIADFSTAIISNGKLHRWRSEGKKCPEPMLIDKESGKPTDDPARFPEHAGILPFGGQNGGFRGTAMSLWAELLSAAVGAKTANPEGKGPQNTHFLLIDQKKMGDPQAYKESAKALIEHLKTSPPAEGLSGPRMPGEMEWALLDNARKNGLELDEYFEHELSKLQANPRFAD